MKREPPLAERPAGLYLHFPFCAIRCTYCDFPTVAGQDDRIATYLRALADEVQRFQLDLPIAVDSIYLGGGTPSRMTPLQLGRLLSTVSRRFDLRPDCEITLEANPESLTPDRLRGYLDAGVNRISIGVQSLCDAVLQRVGRAHRAEDALRSLREASACEGLRVNVDLICGLPGEPLDRWDETIAAIGRLGPDHASVYLLETDEQTPLARSIRSGRTTCPDDEAVVWAYEQTATVLADFGLHQYEISSYARSGQRSRHNMKYWADDWYGGFGLGAHAYFLGRRRGNRRDLAGYLEDLAAGRDPVRTRDPWDPQRRLEEALIMGLRVVDGVAIDGLSRRYGVCLREHYADEWSRAIDRGILEWRDERARLTPYGRLHSNELFRELIRI